jgi:predicted transcriptional regulator
MRDICKMNYLPNQLFPQHLKELKNAGLIKGNFEGNAICYCLNEDGFETLKSFWNIDLYLENKKNKCC